MNFSQYLNSGLYNIFLITLQFSLLKLANCALDSLPEEIIEIEQPKLSPIVKVFQILGQRSTEIPIRNDSFVLTKEHNLVELLCRSEYPIKWEYFVRGNPISSVLEVEYKRVLKLDHNSTISLNDLKIHGNNGFEARVQLRGPLVSQSGLYVCRYYNERLHNNSYELSTNISVFVPGPHIFTEMPHIKYINGSDAFVVIPCPVSNPDLRVSLHKLREDIYIKHKVIKWRSISRARYDPATGFILEAGLGRVLVGDYNCTVETGQSMVVSLVDISSKAEYESVYKMNASCWERESCMRLVRSKRLECHCKDSYALFYSIPNNSSLLDGNSSEAQNRQGHCLNAADGLREVESHTGTGVDWRVTEFFGNEQPSQDICFRDMVRKPLNGTGTRVILRASKMVAHNAQTSLLNLTVIYDGLPNWASGFRIGFRRFGKGNQSGSEVVVVNQEPTSIQLYPLAHYRALWTGVIMDSEEVSHIYVFQPDSLSFGWFQVASSLTEIPESDEKQGGKNESGSAKVYIVICAVFITAILVVVICSIIQLRILEKRKRYGCF